MASCSDLIDIMHLVIDKLAVANDKETFMNMFYSMKSLFIEYYHQCYIPNFNA